MNWFNRFIEQIRLTNQTPPTHTHTHTHTHTSRLKSCGQVRHAQLPTVRRWNKTRRWSCHDQNNISYPIIRFSTPTVCINQLIMSINNNNNSRNMGSEASALVSR